MYCNQCRLASSFAYQLLPGLLGGVVNTGNAGENKDILSTITKNGMYQFGRYTVNSPDPDNQTAQWYVAAFAVNGGYFYIAMQTDLLGVYLGYSTLSNNWVGWTSNLIG